MEKKLLAAEYLMVQGPVINSQPVLKKTGHWQKYLDDMFVIDHDGSRPWGLKAMNCPNAIEFYKQHRRSYRELPLRFADLSFDP